MARAGCWSGAWGRRAFASQCNDPVRCIEWSIRFAVALDRTDDSRLTDETCPYLALPRDRLKPCVARQRGRRMVDVPR